jgi:acyl-CoA thioester hydrolase
MNHARESIGPEWNRTPFRVRYPETDRMGVVYHANYLVWFELGRTELMRQRGCAYADLEHRDGIFFPVVEVNVNYHLSARYDDELVVCTRLDHVGGASVRFDYRLLRPAAAADGPWLASGYTVHAAVGADGRPRRMPEALRARLRPEAEGR